MSKNELFLQLFFILVTATLIALFAVKLYPKDLLKPKPVHAQVLIRPIPSKTTVGARLESVTPPTKLSINSIDLSLTIAPAQILNNEWELFDDKVSWLSSSQTVGNGNVILYAHNRVGLFGGLHAASIGDEIHIEQNGKIYTYIISEKRKVVPQDIDAVLSDSNRLTLYTCEGIFDEKRLVIIAKPKK